MRILILNWRDQGNPLGGGAEFVTFEYAKAWVKVGHEVTIFTSFYPGGKRNEINDGVRFIRQGNQTLGVHIAAFFWYLFKKKNDFDLVVDQIHGIPFFTPLYVRKKKIAFIHEVAKEVWQYNPWPKPLNLIPTVVGGIGEPLIYKFFYRKVPFLTVSDSTKNELVEWGIPQTQITVIHNGVTFPIKKTQHSKEKTKTVIFLGALTADKGIFAALETFAFLQKREPNWQFWVVGKGEPRFVDKLKKFAATLDISKNTTFWGYVSDEKKFELLQKAHILFSPSVREGWGLTILEAASQLTPAVVYNAPGLRDSVINNKTGIIVKKNTPEESAIAITSLFSDTTLYTSLQKNAYHWATEHTWDKAIKKSLELLRSV